MLEFCSSNQVTFVSRTMIISLPVRVQISQRRLFNVYERARKGAHMLKGLKFRLGRNTLKGLDKSLVHPVTECADVVWDGCTERECDLLQHVQYETAKIFTGVIKKTSKHGLVFVGKK